MQSLRRQSQTSYELCGDYVYDEEYGYCVCEADLDEDEMTGLLGSRGFQCPRYQLDDEYRIVRKQMQLECKRR